MSEHQPDRKANPKVTSEQVRELRPTDRIKKGGKGSNDVTDKPFTYLYLLAA
jgi:hypothetical protein